MKIKSFFKKYFDLNLAFILAGFYLMTIILNLIKVFSTAYLEGKSLVIGENIFIEVYLLDAAVVMFMMLLIAMHTKKLILNKTSWKKILLLHFFLAIFIGVIIQVITDWYRLKIGFFESYDIRKSLRIFLSVIDINFLVYFAMLFIIYTYYYVKIIRASEIQQSELQSQLMTTKMNLLKTQLQPHFLFNTINCIIGLIDVDKKKAQDTLVDLSSLFRQFTKISQINTHALEVELQLLSHYIEILKVRFPENLKITIDIDENLMDEMVPTMMFQPLIENAINHGYEYSKGNFIIHIKGFVEVEKMKFIIDNNGPFLNKNSKTSQTGIGIDNLKQRLKNIYGESASFVLQNKTDSSGVENLIELPFK